MAGYKVNFISGKSVGIFTYYNHLVNRRVPVYQRAVFEHYGLQINQYRNDSYQEHGDFLNQITRTVVECDYIIFFDIDCIPVNPLWLDQLMPDLLKPHTIVGAAQTANHLREGKNLYVSPFFCAISTAYLKELDYPDLRMTDQVDGGQNLTETIREKEGNIHFWWPTHIEEEQWDLYHPEHKRFGLGTTYGNAIYHAFFSRNDRSDRFIKKCKSLLPWYTKLWLPVKLKYQKVTRRAAR